MKPIVAAALLLSLSAPALAVPPPVPAVESRGAAPRTLDVNRATAAELLVVPGIGERLAQAIVELRARKGSFAKIDELLEVRGIGEKNLALLKEHLVVGQQAPAAAGASVPQPK